LLESAREALEADVDSQVWRNYKIYADDIVRQGLHSTIKGSLVYLLQNMDGDFLQKNELPPLYEAKLEFNGSDMMYTPSMDQGWYLFGITQLSHLLNKQYRIRGESDGHIQSRAGRYLPNSHPGPVHPTSRRRLHY
jgi:hypothetical protein